MTSPVASRAGGIERVVVECANQLVAAGHDVHVLATRFQPDALDDRVTRVHVPTRRRPDALACLQYRDRAGDLLEQVGGVHGSFSGFSPLGGVFWVPSVQRVAYDHCPALGPAGGSVRRRDGAEPDPARLGLATSLASRSPPAATRI